MLVFLGTNAENFPSLCEWYKNVENDAKMYVLCVFRVKLLKMTRKTYILCFLTENECIYSENCSKIPPENAPQCLFWAIFNENPFKMTHKSTFMCILSEKQTK